MFARLKAINPARNRRRIVLAGGVVTMLSILPVFSARQLESAHATAPGDVIGTTTCSTPYNFVSASAITSAGTSDAPWGRRCGCAVSWHERSVRLASEPQPDRADRLGVMPLCRSDRA